MYELTSENEGLLYFNCTLQINETNFALNGYEIGETEGAYNFTWQVLRSKTLD